MVAPVHVDGVTEDVNDTTSDDLLLAQMLQLEFDREHDLLVSAQEKHHNKNNKSESRPVVVVIYLVSVHCSCHFF